MRVPYETMLREFERVLKKNGMSAEKAAVSARLFADASRDGVYTHGLNRFPAHIAAIRKGDVRIDGEPVLKERFGALARYDGQLGPGNLNALFCLHRAMELADQFGVGIAALSNTTHWMRPGNYGLEAAEKGYISILWTNTLPNMAPWGGKEVRIGNNPLVMALPSPQGPVLLDMAMSMFSYGKIASYLSEGKMLPVDGGFDDDGAFTRDPAIISANQQALPIGFWKGSGLSLLLDLIASAVSGGQNTFEIGQKSGELGVSQMFILIRLDAFGDAQERMAHIEASLQNLKETMPRDPKSPVRFPGEGMLRLRRENTELGIPVDEAIWNKVCSL